MDKKLILLFSFCVILIGCNDLNGTNIQETKYNIFYNGNGNTSGSVPMDNNLYLSGEEAVVMGKGSLEKTGYEFINWNTNQQGTGNSFNSGEKIAINSSNVTLYAIWNEQGKYTVTFETFDGSSVQSLENVISGSKITKPTNPTKANSAFEGWFIDEEFETAWDFQNDVVVNNLTLFAKWRSTLYQHEVTNIYHLQVGFYVVIYWTNPIDSNFSHVRIIPAGFEWADSSALDQEPGITSYSVLDFANTEYLIIKCIGKDGNVSEGIKYYLSNMANPIASDFNISGLGTYTYDGNTRTVTITPKVGSSQGEITIYYNGSTTAPIAVGTYTVTFDVAAITGFNAATGLTAGTLVINEATTVAFFTGLTADGSTITATTKLSITFDKDISNLSVGDIILIPGSTNASKGALTSIGNGVYELELTSITSDGEIIVTISKNGYTITPDSLTVSIFTGPIMVTNTNDWNTALNTIKTGGNNKSYTINVVGDVAVPGNTSNTFGAVSNLTVTLTGNGKLYLTERGNLVRIATSNQTLIIDGTDLFLEGLTSGKNGATQNNNTNVISVSNGRLELRNGTISGNTGATSGGGVGFWGSTFIMTGGTITGNTCSSYGGGIFIQSATFEMSGGIINDNTASVGGGIYIDQSDSNFIMTGGNITGNTCYGSYGSGGGGVYFYGSFTMAGGNISNNNATNGSGGGIYVNGIFLMSDGIISSNSTNNSGGGVFVGGTFTMTGGILSGNTSSSTNGGGGVYISYSNGHSSWGNFNKTGGIIFGNDAENNEDKNIAVSDTKGHAVLCSDIYTADYYRDITLNKNDNLNTKNDPFPTNAGETLNGWTRP